MSWLNIFLDINHQLANAVINYGSWIYGILFLIILAEIIIFFFPFLPGDSLLFFLGAFIAGGIMNPFILVPLLSLAAILGNIIAYIIGKYFGEYILIKWKIINKNDLEKTRLFFAKHGGKAIITSRFIPIIRSLAPLTAGLTKMNYTKFISYSVLGAIIWISLFLTAGYYFGSIQYVKDNLEAIVLIIVLLSIIIPIILKFLKKKTKEIENVIEK